MMAATTAITADDMLDDRAVNGRAAARDAALFLAVAEVSALIAFLTALFGPADESATAVFVTGAASWVGLTLAGIYKLVRCYRTGVSDKWSLGSGLLAYLNVAAALLLFCVGYLPRALELWLPNSATAIIGLLPLAYFSLGLLWLLHKQHRDTGLARRSACFLGLSALFVAYIVAILLDFRGGAVFSQIGADNAPLLFRICAWGAGSVAAIAYGFCLRELFLLRRRGVRSTAAGWVLFGAWFMLAVSLSISAFIISSEPSTILGAVSAIASALAAGIVGTLVSRPWRQKRTWVVRWAVTLPLLLALWAVVPVGAGMYSCIHFPISDYYEVRPLVSPHPWVWYAPEAIRAPFARAIAARNKQAAADLFRLGLAEVKDLRQQALTDDLAAFISWHQRDPKNAFAIALAVGTGTKPGCLPATPYDLSAGFVIATAGTDVQIRERLTGNYSDQMICGIIMGLGDKASGAGQNKFATELENIFSSRCPDRHCWRMFAYNFPHLLQRRARQLLTASPPDYKTVSVAVTAAYYLAQSIVDQALDSRDTVIRQLALQTWPTESNRQKILASARGQTPGCVPNERRLAAAGLDRLLNRKAKPAYTSINPLTASGTPAVSAPLTPTEAQDIAKLCDEAAKR